MNMADNLDKTPLFYAVEVGNIKAVDILLKYKAEYNWIDCFGRTPV
jgi:ankyrin repeat protein